MGALQCPTSDPPSAVTGEAGDKEESERSREAVSAPRQLERTETGRERGDCGVDRWRED
jgi:hypothetical protein